MMFTLNERYTYLFNDQTVSSEMQYFSIKKLKVNANKSEGGVVLVACNKTGFTAIIVCRYAV